MYLSENPYRVLGVLANSSIREIHKNISKLKAHARVKKDMSLEYDLSFLNLSSVDRKEDHIIIGAENKIKLDKNRVQFGIYWFVDLLPVDSVSLSHVVKGDFSKSIELWKKSIKSDEVSIKNFSAFNNLSTLLMLVSLDDSKTDTFKKDHDSITNIRESIRLKYDFLSSGFLNNFCESISKSSFVNSDDVREFYLTTTIDLLQKNFNSNELLSICDGLHPDFRDKLSSLLTDIPLANIYNHIENSADLIEEDPSSGIEVGKKLIKSTLSDFKNLKQILGDADFQFETISDKLANQILQCGIVCYNETRDDQDYLNSYKYALSIARGEQTISRAEDCVKHCEEEKKANICSGCNNRQVKQENLIEEVMYKETNRTWFPRRVEYQTLTLKLFFCDHCYSEYKDKKALKLKIKFWFVAIGFLIGLVNTGGEIAGGILFGIFSFVIGWIFSLIVVSSSNLTREHPLVRKYKQEGWGFSQPTA